MVRRGRCRCGKVLTFRYGPDGLKRRCGQCGSIVRLRITPAEPPADVNATEKKLPVWTYSPTEEMAQVGSEMQVAWSSADAPALRGTQDREVLDAVAADEWVSLEEATQPARGRRVYWIIGAVGLLLAGGIGAWFMIG